MSERDTSDKPQLTPDCCEVWPRLIKHLRWFTYSDWPEIATMPNIDDNGTYWRVNFCPSCGADQRGATRLVIEVR